MERKHIFNFDALAVQARTGLRGGTGPVNCRDLLTADNRVEGSCFKAVGLNILPPASSIGLHSHTEDEELYLILKGEGTFTNSLGTKVQLKPGDVTICYRGESHMLENTGSEDLLLAGIVIAQP